MTDQSGSSSAALPAAPDAVGKNFIEQYYNILYSHPEIASKFYERDGEAVLSQPEICQSVIALGGDNFDIEIIDAKFQKSDMGGVFLMVMGLLSNKLTANRQKFLQSFLLAPQSETALCQYPQNYFVLNDILWYLDDDDSQTSNSASMFADGLNIPSHVPTVTEAGVSSPTHHEAQVTTNPIPLVKPTVQEKEDIIEAQDVISLEDSSHVEDRASVSDEALVLSSEETLGEAVKPPSMALPQVPAPVSSSEEGSTEAPKPPPEAMSPLPLSRKETFESSYKEMLLQRNYTSSGQQMKEKAGSTVRSATITASPKVTASPVHPQALTSSLSIFGTTGQSTRENKGSHYIGDERSVFVRNFPSDVSIEQLREQLNKFGLLQAGRAGLTVKRDLRYAFVHFEESASARAAIASTSRIFIGGHRVYIEERIRGRSRRAPRTG